MSTLGLVAWLAFAAVCVMGAVLGAWDNTMKNDQVRQNCPATQIETRVPLIKPRLVKLRCRAPATEP